MKTLHLFLLLGIILLTACISKVQKDKDESIDNLKRISYETKINDSDTINHKVIFSTSDLKKAKFLSAQEINKKIKLTDYVGSEGEVDCGFIILPNCKDKIVAIQFIQGDENSMYYLGAIKDNAFIVDNAVDVSPEWYEPEDNGKNYMKRTFEIYDDYSVSVKTKEVKNGMEQNYVKHFNLNGDGKYIDVK